MGGNGRRPENGTEDRSEVDRNKIRPRIPNSYRHSSTRQPLHKNFGGCLIGEPRPIRFSPASPYLPHPLALQVL